MNLGYIEDKHLPELLRLNNLAVPAVNHLTLDALEILVNGAAFAQLMADEYAIAGFVLAFDQNASYDGFNYQWFKQRLNNFLYVDRIIVSPSYRGQGVGKQIYEATFQYAREQQCTAVTCEVNVEPNNPDSHAFHQALGFEQMQQVRHPEGKTVAMYQRSLV